MFPIFARELKLHNASGYHVQTNIYDLLSLSNWFLERGIKAPTAYLDFISSFGAGFYFGGSLVFFPLDHDNLASISSVTGRLIECHRDDIFAFGYNGTTEGCFCLDRTSLDDCVYWFSWSEMGTSILAKNFTEWVETQQQLFNEKIYQGYKPVRDMKSIRAVVEARTRFQVRLLNFDKQLVRPPGKEKDILPRYHKIALGITKTKEGNLEQITVVIRRVGSKVGLVNKEYVTLNVENLPLGNEAQMETYAFDPFNLPFEKIEIEFSPEINLGDPMRVRFAEIKPYL